MLISLAQDGRGTNETAESGTNETAESGLLVKKHILGWQLNCTYCFRLHFNCVLCIIFGRIAYIVYDPHFKRRLLDN